MSNRPRRPRVVYYTYPAFLDPALLFVREMSRRVELHLVLELSPEAWQSALFDVPPAPLPAGVQPADPVLRACFPPAVRAYWQDCAGFHLVVHRCPRSVHPATWRVSHQAARFMRDLAPDLVHLDDVSLRLAWALPELRGLPLVLSLHDPEPHSGDGGWRLRLKRRLAIRGGRRFILHNRALRAPFCAVYRVPAARVTVIPLGVYTIFREWLAEPVGEDGPTVLFFGRLTAYKGLDLLYAAAPAVAEHVPGVRFVVAGRPVGGYRLPPAPVLPNGGRLEVLERYLHNAELAALFARATLVVCPYHEATQSGVVLTAYAFGKPVVATRVGGLPEYVIDGQTGLLVAPHDAAALAAALIQVLGDPAGRARMAGATARLAADGLSWAAIAGQTAGVYRQALGGRGDA